MSGEEFSRDEVGDVVKPEKKVHTQLLKTEIRRSISAPPDEYGSAGSPSTPDFRSDADYMVFYERQHRLNPRLPPPVPSRSAWFGPKASPDWAKRQFSNNDGSDGTKNAKSKFNFNDKSVFPPINDEESGEIRSVKEGVSSSSIGGDIGNEVVNPSNPFVGEMEAPTTNPPVREPNRDGIEEVIKGVANIVDDDPDEPIIPRTHSTSGSGHVSPEQPIQTEMMSTDFSKYGENKSSLPPILNPINQQINPSLGDSSLDGSDSSTRKSSLSVFSNLESSNGQSSSTSSMEVSSSVARPSSSVMDDPASLPIPTKTASPFVPTHGATTATISSTSAAATSGPNSSSIVPTKSTSSGPKSFDTKSFFHPKSLTDNPDGRKEQRPAVYNTYTTKGYKSSLKSKNSRDYKQMFSPLGGEIGGGSRKTLNDYYNNDSSSTQLFSSSDRQHGNMLNDRYSTSTNRYNTNDDHYGKGRGGGGGYGDNNNSRNNSNGGVYHDSRNSSQQRGGYDDYNQRGSSQDSYNTRSGSSGGGGMYSSQHHNQYDNRSSHHHSQNNYSNNQQQQNVNNYGRGRDVYSQFDDYYDHQQNQRSSYPQNQQGNDYNRSSGYNNTSNNQQQHGNMMYGQQQQSSYDNNQYDQQQQRGRGSFQTRNYRTGNDSNQQQQGQQFNDYGRSNNDRNYGNSNSQYVDPQQQPSRLGNNNSSSINLSKWNLNTGTNGGASSYTSSYNNNRGNNAGPMNNPTFLGDGRFGNDNQQRNNNRRGGFRQQQTQQNQYGDGYGGGNDQYGGGGQQNQGNNDRIHPLSQPQQYDHMNRQSNQMGRNMGGPLSLNPMGSGFNQQQQHQQRGGMRSFRHKIGGQGGMAPFQNQYGGRQQQQQGGGENMMMGGGMNNNRGGRMSRNMGGPMILDGPGGMGKMIHPPRPKRKHVNLSQGATTMLEQIRAQSKEREYTIPLSALLEYVAELSKDQVGSRFVQKQIEDISNFHRRNQRHHQSLPPYKTVPPFVPLPQPMKVIDDVFEKILPSALELMTDVFGNYVIQKFFEYGTESHVHRLCQKFRGSVLNLTLQTYGCRVIQKALDVIKHDDDKKIIQDELSGYVLKCVQDQNGNHVVQKCVEKLSPDHIDFILKEFSGSVRNQAVHAYGCRVIQRILEFCTEAQKEPLLREICQSVALLVKDQYGNYVVQHVLEHRNNHIRFTNEGVGNDPNTRSSLPKTDVTHDIIGEIARLVVDFSFDKFASNVIEKCFEHGHENEKRLVVEEIVRQEKHSGVLFEMMKHQYANYVVQKTIELSSPASRKLLIDCILSYLPYLKGMTYGKHIITCINRYSGNPKI